MSTPPIPRRIAVCAYSKLPESVTEAEQISAFLNARGVDAFHGTLDDAPLRTRVKAGDFDLLIVAGGDGTMLRASHLCAPAGLPMLGINLGRVGFLIQVQKKEWRAALGQLFKGDFWIEKRMMLRASHMRSGELNGSWHALNEAVVCRGAAVRPIRFSTHVDGRLLTTYVADGLIASTATGSTAYALASGGPILPPELRNILLVPIAPHLSVDRAVVLSEGSSVSVLVQAGEAVLSVDGQNPVALDVEDSVEVCAGEYGADFVRFGEPDYFYRNLTAHMNQNSTIGSPR